jgi:hypothetical protein
MKIPGLTSRGWGYRAVRIIALIAVPLLAGSVHSLSLAPRALALRRHHLPMQIHRQRNQNTAESYNWSGYGVVAATGAVTEVKSSWVVPSVASTCAEVPAGYAAFWTGIDGWNSSTVEQIGTDSDCVSLNGDKTGTPTYYAWFEFYPQDAYLIGRYGSSGACEADCVVPGDRISAEVKLSPSTPGRLGPAGVVAHLEGPQFTVTITDQTQGWSYTTSSTVPGAKLSSAEWISEAPYGCHTPSRFCELSNFGTVDYGDYLTAVAQTSYATVAGVTQPIGSFGSKVVDAVMVKYPAGTTTMAEPAPLEGGGTSFTALWSNPGP